MIGGVSLYGVNQAYKKAETGYSQPVQLKSNAPAFGYREEPQQGGVLQSIKDSFLTVTDDVVSLVGLNVALVWLQNFVNGKLLVGKINKHVTDKITPEERAKLPALADEMLEKHGLKNKVGIDYHGKLGEAFYTHDGNFIRVGSNQHSSLFHEIGHAVEENNTRLFKWLQRGRGNYSILALGLYALLSGRQQQFDGNYSIGSSLTKTDVAIPLLAFAPELITEAKASMTGLKFLKEKLKTGAISESLYKNTKRSYLACFGTYLFIPLSIIIMDALRSGANKVREKYTHKQNQYYY